MACKLLIAGLLALVAAEDCPADATALHQAKLQLRSVRKGPDFVTPSKSQIAKVRPELKTVVEGVVKRTTNKASLPSVPAVFRWELTGKATKWALEQYQKPRTAASLELLENMIGMASDVAGSADFATAADMDLMERLANITKLAEAFKTYVRNSGLPKAVEKLVDAYAAAAKEGKEIDRNTTNEIFVDVANETNGPNMANLVKAMTAQPLDMPKVCELYMPVLKDMGAPPSVEKFFQDTAELMKKGVAVDAAAEELRMTKMMANASKELNLPSSISDALDFVVDQKENGQPSSYYADKPEEAEKILKKMYDIFSNLVKQLGGSDSLAELVKMMTRNHTESEMYKVMATSFRELQLPAEYSEMLDYMSSLATHTVSPDMNYIIDLFSRVGTTAGVPAAYGKFMKDAAAVSQKDKDNTEKLNKELIKMFTKLLKTMGLPAFAEIFAKVGGPLVKGKKPDALALASLAPTMTKVLPDVETVLGLAKEGRAKLLSPLQPIVDKAAARLTAGMPETPLKAGVKEALGKVKVH